MKHGTTGAQPLGERWGGALAGCLLAGCLLGSLSGCGAGPRGKGPVVSLPAGSANKIDAHQTALSGHQRAVLVAQFSPNGQLILTASEDRTARLWLTTSGRTAATLSGHRKAVTCGAFSPDGLNVVTGSDDRTARLWHITGEAIAVLRGHEKGLTSVSFSPDGEAVLTTSMDRTARLWRRRDGRALAVLKGHGDFVQTAAFSPDGKTIVTASMDGTARVWRLDVKGKVPTSYRPKRRPDTEGGPVNKPFELATGVPACDTYLVKYMQCMISSGKFSPSVRESVERSLMQAAHAWRQAAATPAGRKALTQSCKLALVAAKRSMASWGCKW